MSQLSAKYERHCRWWYLQSISHSIPHLRHVTPAWSSHRCWRIDGAATPETSYMSAACRILSKTKYDGGVMRRNGIIITPLKWCLSYWNAWKASRLSHQYMISSCIERYAWLYKWWNAWRPDLTCCTNIMKCYHRAAIWWGCEVINNHLSYQIMHAENDDDMK